MTTTKETYKLRAECMHDITKSLTHLSSCGIDIEVINIERLETPLDFTLEFMCDDIESFKKEVYSLDDTHVMLDTLSPIGEYTGERTYIY